MKNRHFNFLIFILIIIELFIIRLSSFHESYYFLAPVVIIINSIIIGCLLLGEKDKFSLKINHLILLAYIVRLVILFLDVYYKWNFFTGKDTEGFYNYAIGIYSVRRNYSAFLKVLVSILGPNRMILEYINVMASLFSMIIMKKILFLICKDKKKIIYSFIIFSFAPVYILLSSCLLRESIMIFLNTVSIYFFILWYKNGKNKDFIISILLIFVSSFFHSGVLGLIIGYAISYIIYNPQIKKTVFSRKTIFSLVFIFGILILLFILFGESVTVYFNKIESIEDITRKIAYGTTDYLTYLNNNDSRLIIIASIPLKIVYFYLSPLIWDINSWGLLLIFLLSSSIYLILLKNILFSNANNSYLKKLLVLSLIFVSIIYALGVSNTGTALRHREKMLPYFIVLYSISYKKTNAKIGSDKYEKNK